MFLHRDAMNSAVSGAAGGLSYWHQPGANAFPFLTMGQLAGQAAALYAEREALVSVDEGVRMSFKELLREVRPPELCFTFRTLCRTPS